MRPVYSNCFQNIVISNFKWHSGYHMNDGFLSVTHLISSETWFTATRCEILIKSTALEFTIQMFKLPSYPVDHQPNRSLIPHVRSYPKISLPFYTLRLLTVLPSFTVVKIMIGICHHPWPKHVVGVPVTKPLKDNQTAASKPISQGVRLVGDPMLHCMQHCRKIVLRGGIAVEIRCLIWWRRRPQCCWSIRS
jgi:hypothetical protein